MIPLLFFPLLSTFLTHEFSVPAVFGVGQRAQCQSIAVHSKHQSALDVIEIPICRAQVFPEICGFHPVYGTSTQQGACLVHLAGSCPTFQGVLNFMSYTDFPLLARPGDKFFPFLFLSSLPREYLGWSFQSPRFQRRQRAGLFPAAPAPPTLPLESLKQRIWMGLTTCSEQMNAK